MNNATIGIGGAAGDGLDKTGDTLAKTAARLGLHVYAYNSYQSVIRGGHIWLRVRLGQEKVSSQGNHLHALIALNQDSIERHASEVEPGGVVLFNADKLRCNVPLRDNVLPAPLPVGELTKPFGAAQPVMQNTVAIGALLFLLGLDFEVAGQVLTDTFTHKGKAVVDQNVNLARAGYEYARERYVPLGCRWNFSRKPRPFITGNEAFSLGAVAAGCKFYSAYPMTPASSILHWMAAHGERCGIVVKQCEDELAVANMAIGAGFAGVRAMCGTSGGGFALMTEAIGQAGMIEAPVVIILVQRGGPSTGIPTKTEQADLNQAFGASQGDFPRIIIAPVDTPDCFHSMVEAFNLAEKYQLPVIIISDLLLSEHPETIELTDLPTAVPIERGELINRWNGQNGNYKRYAFTPSGVSPRALPGTPNALHVAATDEHDEEGILISDVFTNPAVRRKIAEKRMRKLALALGDLPAPQLEGPSEAEVTLIGWGSTQGVIREARQELAAVGVRANHLHFKYLLPFHRREAGEILERSKRSIAIEVNATGQFARHLRAETGYTVHDRILKYDGEPFEPRNITEEVCAILEGWPRSLDVTSAEAREIAYHYIRTHLNEELRPGQIEKASADGAEQVWRIEIVHRDSGQKHGELRVGVETGSTYSWQPAS
ncbi:MAG TPA: 2-oxoacid:acceptor oxidoreductase subunit alpha [Candidatus Acidoferrales bacterium]|nr:2-oxoacid:acceptor oxidoreductase subunit alpha [Candidatus Acidoferrales bacterium]